MIFPGSGHPAPRAAMAVDDPDQMPLMPPSSPSPPPTLTPQPNDGGCASVVVTMDGSGYGTSSSIRIIREPSSSSQPPPAPSSTGSKKASSANGGFAIKSPSRSAHSSASAKTSAQVPSGGVVGWRGRLPLETATWWVVVGFPMCGVPEEYGFATARHSGTYSIPSTLVRRFGYIGLR